MSSRIFIFCSKGSILLFHLNTCGGSSFQFSKKHHCRKDGRIYCDNCTSRRIPIQKYGLESAVRVCENCYNECRVENRFLSITLPFLIEGEVLTRWTHDDKPTLAVFNFSSTSQQFTWSSKELVHNKPIFSEAVSLGNIISVRTGLEGGFFRSNHLSGPKQKHCFTLTYKEKESVKYIGFEAKTSEVRDQWVRSIVGVKEYYQKSNSSCSSAENSQEDQKRIQRALQKEDDVKRRTEDFKKKYNFRR